MSPRIASSILFRRGGNANDDEDEAERIRSLCDYDAFHAWQELHAIPIVFRLLFARHCHVNGRSTATGQSFEYLRNLASKPETNPRRGGQSMTDRVKPSAGATQAAKKCLDFTGMDTEVWHTIYDEPLAALIDAEHRGLRECLRLLTDSRVTRLVPRRWGCEVCREVGQTRASISHGKDCIVARAEKLLGDQ
jgi:hypothetical protein